MRRITTIGAGETRQLTDLLQNLLVSELLAPSNRLWVLSPWISDIVVIDNASGQFKSVLPALPARPIRLTEVLLELARRGSDVRVIMRDEPRNTVTGQRLTDLAPVGPRPTLLIRNTLHDKGMVSDRFHVHGSMNFTFFGQRVNQEGVTVVSDPDQIARAWVEYQNRYQLP
ncbi:phospholipase D-like domain-containing protein DpdK [Streptomyces sp. NPDC058411]|uniref:phospholipase D-like domain-containing protein DpdK n=1 Tax=Streptomyces sp. NPDC058411 TaxID=3346485 RepID=UPI00365C5244